jgi:hypothetical protein
MKQGLAWRLLSYLYEDESLPTKTLSVALFTFHVLNLFRILKGGDMLAIAKAWAPTASLKS